MQKPVRKSSPAIPKTLPVRAPKPTPVPETPEKDPPLLSRDLTWLAFNYRVLQEAQDLRVPLLERLNFMAIFSSNLDEFFKVRVATLRRLLKLKKKTRARIARHLSEELDAVMQEVVRQQREFGEIFRNVLQPALREAGIMLVNHHNLTAAQRTFAEEYFAHTLQPLLKPVYLNEELDHIFLKDQSVFMIAEMRERQPDLVTLPVYALLEIPTKLHGGRFLKLPTEAGTSFVMFIDDVIRLGLPHLFPEMEVVSAHTIKISRDAELDIGEDVPGNMLAKIQRSIKKREKGVPSRLLVDPGMPVALLELLRQKTGCAPEQVIIGSPYHNFRDFLGFPDMGRPDIVYEPQPPLPHPGFPAGESIFTTLAGGEKLLHFPYQSYEPVIRFFREAAEDPNVSAISCTLYRVAAKSEIAKALIKAAKNGKFVTVLVELKARFDEESNVSWARKLERSGAFVIYGVPELKVHCKMALVTRRENRHTVTYSYLSTGNFNESTARVYTDYGFFTRDKRLTKEMDQIFQFFIDQSPEQRFNHLLVAPFNLRKQLMALIDTEIAFAQKKKPASITLKLNSLQDGKMILKLYKASQAGVKINLIVRGICTLVPGRKGLSTNITVRSIVDRYLEHARVFIFGNGGEEKMYVSSADWMTRNLSRRVETAFPIYDPQLQAVIRREINLQLQDTVKARTPANQYLLPPEGKKPVQSQLETYRAYL